jgi:hypothetical protein
VAAALTTMPRPSRLPEPAQDEIADVDEASEALDDSWVGEDEAWTAHEPAYRDSPDLIGFGRMLLLGLVVCALVWVAFALVIRAIL